MMDAEYREQLIEQLRLKRKLLHEREMQLARGGINVDPSITIAAEDLRADVRQLEAELGIDRPVYRPPPPRYEPTTVPEPVFQQRMVGQQATARQRDIEHQMTLLSINRQNLAHYRTQTRAHGGIEFAPPMTRNGMQEHRQNIARIKDILRGYGQAVDDLPGDE